MTFIKYLFSTILGIGILLGSSSQLFSADYSHNPSEVTVLSNSVVVVVSNLTEEIAVISNEVVAVESNLTVEINTKVSSNELASTTLGDEGIRRIGAFGGYELDEFFEDTYVRGPARDKPQFVFENSNLTITYSDGDVYDPVNGYFKLDSGTKTLTDNAINYAYWSTTDVRIIQWTTGTRPDAINNIYLATFITSQGRIIYSSTTVAAGDILLYEDAAFAQTFPSLILSGLNVYPTGTALTNIIINYGIEYHNLADRIEHPTVNLNTSSNLVVYTHSNLLWTSVATNKLLVGMWDNGTNLVACNATKWYRGVFVSLTRNVGQLTWIAPDFEYASEADCLAGGDPYLPPAFSPYIPKCTAYVFKGDDTELRTDGTYWVDRRNSDNLLKGSVAGGSSGNTPPLGQVLLAGSDTGGILPSGMGMPVTDDQGANKGYVDSVGNKAYANPTFSSDSFILTNRGRARFSTADIPEGTTNTYILPSEGGVLATYTDIQVVPIAAIVGEAGGIAKGRVVYQSGASSGKPEVKYADRTQTLNLPVVGIASASGNLGDIIEIVNFGPITGLNTTNFTSGQTMYLGLNGELSIRSTSSDATILMGTCVLSNPTNGSILVNIRSYYQDGGFAGSMRYAIENNSSATNATANFFVLNNVKEAMRIGIRSTNHFLGKGAYLVNSANGLFISGNARTKGYQWNIDMTDSGTDYAHNLWPMMSLIPQIATSNAFLGIGTTNPLVSLDVRGSMVVSNAYRMSSGTYSNTEFITFGETTNRDAIVSNAFFAADTNLSNRINTETNRAYNVETNLQEQIASETNRAIGVETNLSNRINTETNRAILYEIALSNYIAAVSNNLYASDTNLSNRINTETNRAIQYEIALSNYIAAVSNNLYASDTNLSNRINTETNRAIQYEIALSNYIAAVSNNLYASDTNLSNRINTETNRAIQYEIALSNYIAAVSNNLYASDTNLSNRINTETNRATVAETNLQNQINTTTNRVRVVEDQTNLWNTAATPSTKFFATLLNNQTFTQSQTNKVAYSNLVLNVGGTYSNVVSRWIPKASNVMIRLSGSVNLAGIQNNDIIKMFVFKNGTIKSTVWEDRGDGTGAKGKTFVYVDITASTNDYYEMFLNMTGNNRTTAGSSSNNWWSGEIVY